VIWVAHLGSRVSLSADAVAIVEHDFDRVAEELRAAAAELLGDSQVPWEFQWRQGLIAHELIAVVESVSGRPARRRGGHRGRELLQRDAPHGRLGRGQPGPPLTGAGHHRALVRLAPLGDRCLVGAGGCDDEIDDRIQGYRRGVDHQVVQGRVGRVASV